jgi:hypothetical protein
LVQLRRPYLYAARKKLTGEQTEFATLLDDRLCGIVCISSEFRLVNLQVKAFEALNACKEPRFAKFRAHGRSVYYISPIISRD